MGHPSAFLVCLSEVLALRRRAEELVIGLLIIVNSLVMAVEFEFQGRVSYQFASYFYRMSWKAPKLGLCRGVWFGVYRPSFTRGAGSVCIDPWALGKAGPGRKVKLLNPRAISIQMIDCDCVEVNPGKESVQY